MADSAHVRIHESTPPADTLVPARRHTLLTWLCWLYVIGLSVIAVGMPFLGGVWWPATLLLYAPRFLLGLPLLILLPWALAVRRRLLILLGIGLFVLCDPIMGWCWPPLLRSDVASSEDRHLTVLTCNIYSNAVSPNTWNLLLQRTKPDVIGLQESASNWRQYIPDGWHAVRQGSIVLASRFPLQETAYSASELETWSYVDAVCGSIEVDGDTVQLAVVHLISPQHAIRDVLDRETGIDTKNISNMNDKMTRRRLESRRVADWVSKRAHHPLIVMGDFNLAAESRIYHESWSWLTNAFSQVGSGFGYTKQTPLGPLEFGTRIDHILCNKQVLVRTCQVQDDVGSDHLPVVAEVVIQP
ncbi:MAG: endonuclease/exonuclease/phosphatase family protein [Pirellulaceae bacterium]